MDASSDNRMPKCARCGYSKHTHDVVRTVGGRDEWHGLCAAFVETADESGWLIETAQNTYWDGRQTGDDAVFLPNANEAVRFSRQQDAEVVRCWLLEKTGRSQRLRTAEHMFIVS